jgi:hypothetical protein
MQHRVQRSAAAEKREAIAVTAQFGKEIGVVKSCYWLWRAHNNAFGDAKLFHIGEATFGSFAKASLPSANKMHVDVNVRRWRSDDPRHAIRAHPTSQAEWLRYSGGRCERATKACDQIAACDKIA